MESEGALPTPSNLNSSRIQFDAQVVHLGQADGASGAHAGCLLMLPGKGALLLSQFRK